MVNDIINKPDVRKPIPKRLAGEYLAMELRKSSVTNSEGGIKMKFRSNYLEYFTRLARYSSCEPTTGIRTKCLKLCNFVVRNQFFSNKLNRDPLLHCFQSYSRAVKDPFLIFDEHLFPMINRPLFFEDDKKNNSFIQIVDLSKFDKLFKNRISIYEDLHLWSISLLTVERDLDPDMFLAKPFNELIDPVNMWKMVSESAKLYISQINQMPNWMIVQSQFNHPKMNNNVLLVLDIDSSYYLKLFNILYESDTRIEMERKIIEFPIYQKRIHTVFDENSKLTDISVFDQFFPKSNEGDHYDLTAINYGYLAPHGAPDFRLGIPYHKSNNKSEKFIVMCLEEIKAKINVAGKIIKSSLHRSNNMKLNRNFMIMEPFIMNLMRAYCVHNLGLKRVPIRALPQNGHAISLVRSFDKKQWYHAFPYESMYNKLRIGNANTFPKSVERPYSCSNTIAPYFMFYVHLHHKDDNWANITRLVTNIFNNPDVRMSIPERLPGEYLAMELLKSTAIIPKGGQIMKFPSNFLEYYTRLASYSSSEPTTGIRTKFWKFCNRIRETKYFTNKLNKHHLITCYTTFRDNLFDPFIAYNQHLFHMLNEPQIFEDDKKNEKFVKIPDASASQLGLKSYIVIYNDLHLWSIGLLALERGISLNELLAKPISDRIDPVDMVEMVSNAAKQFISKMPKDELPYWIIIYPDNNLYNVIKMPEMTIILYKDIKVIELQSKISQLPVYQKLSLVNTEADHYDITAIRYGYQPTYLEVNFENSIPIYVGSSEKEKLISMCLLHIKEEITEARSAIEHGPKKVRLDINYPKMEPLIMHIMRAYCAYTLGFIRVPVTASTEKGHAVALVRSLNKRKWFYVSNNHVSPILDIEEAIYAHREEQLLDVQLSKVGEHDSFVDKWDKIIGRNKFRLSWS
ncbi:hypothetical protein SNEBB_004146 [Seison nebaliae]|nr:hypothetical protein SNEBB_004146 [Seison nebaliae]